MNQVRHFLVAGIDFGTSYTKVYIEDQFTDRTLPVLFGSNRSPLFPSYVQVKESEISGPLDLVDSKDDWVMIPYLKLMLADEVAGRREFEGLYGSGNLPAAEVLVAAFLRNLMNRIEDFLHQDDKWEDFDTSRDLIVYQIAVPTGLIEQSDLEDRILDCLKAAVRLQATALTQLSLENVAGALNSLHDLGSNERELLESSCFRYPEVASAVQAMVRSRNLPEGKYLTMDVGAGTVDLNFFNNRAAYDSDDTATIDNWEAAVSPLGAARLEHLHPDAGPHERTGACLAEQEIRRQLKEEVFSLMRKVFDLQPRRPGGAGPDVFQSGFHAFILGGGANIPLYEEALLEALRELGINLPHAARVSKPTVDFTLPEGIEDFGRLTVAYGLARSPENLRQARLPEEMRELLGKAWQAAEKNRLLEDMACSCYSNDNCWRCHGTGIIQGERNLRTNLVAMDLWKIRRNVVANPAAGLTSLPEIGSLVDQLQKLDKFRKRQLIGCAYVTIKRIEQLVLSLPEWESCRIHKTDARKTILKACKAEREEEVLVDFSTWQPFEGGMEADVTFALPGNQGKKTARIRCACEKLPDRNQGGLITRIFARIRSINESVRLFLRIDEQDEKPPQDDELKNAKANLDRLLCPWRY
jgi:hypothetical protein